MRCAVPIQASQQSVGASRGYGYGWGHTNRAMPATSHRAQTDLTSKFRKVDPKSVKRKRGIDLMTAIPGIGRKTAEGLKGLGFQGV
jgi:predicted flap endonuclease-1-like 5' DNA nuclease